MSILAALFVVLLSAPVFGQSDWEHYTFEGGRSANSITTITEDNSGNIWVGTLEKLHWYSGIEWQSVDEINGITEFKVNDITVGPNGDVWAIISGLGILKFSNGIWTLFKEGAYVRLAVDCHGNLWTSTSGEGFLHNYDGDTWTSYGYYSNITIKHVYDIATTDSGDIWVGTYEGVYRTRVDSLDSWTVYTEEDGLPDNNIHDVDIGPNGDIWVYSMDNGISHLEQGIWHPITHEDDEVDPEGVDNLEVDNYGTPWCKHVKYHLCAYMDSAWETNFYEPVDFFYYSIHDMFIDSQDRIWIGNDKGLFCHQLEPTVVGVQEEEPESFTLSPPTPNPFNPITTITYSLTESSPVTLAVYNVSGQKVVTLVEEQQAAGMHSATFDGTGLASGLYFARITAGGVVRTEKMVLMK